MPLNNLLPRIGGVTAEMPSPLVIFSGPAGKVVSVFPDQLSYDPHEDAGTPQQKRTDYDGGFALVPRSSFLDPRLFGGDQDAYSHIIGSDPPAAGKGGDGGGLLNQCPVSVDGHTRDYVICSSFAESSFSM